MSVQKSIYDFAQVARHYNDASCNYKCASDDGVMLGINVIAT